MKGKLNKTFSMKTSCGHSYQNKLKFALKKRRYCATNTLSKIPTGATIVNTRIHVEEQEDYWYYILDSSPINTYDKTDICLIKMYISLMLVLIVANCHWLRVQLKNVGSSKVGQICEVT